jgi:outer membrane receptor protein involved in Fe transport
VLETPRSMSVIGSETIDLFGLSAVEDLVRVLPGAYTTTRWGIQGSIDLRNVPADTFFRGMKRLNLQGHGRSVLAAMETIEIVRGPPSPIFGMSKIGGYTNMVPQSVRAATGSYLLEPTGFLQGVAGTFNRAELSFGVGGPLPLERRAGGYYVYGLLEDSESYVEHVPIEQALLQASFTIDDFAGPFRLEAGINAQRSGTAGALLGRFTQSVVDEGRYLRGEPLVNLDLNGNGRIGYLEMYGGSPVAGDIDATNNALRQYWPWPTDAGGEPLPLDAFPRVAGIPVSLYDHLLAHPEKDPTGLLRAQGPGGPLPASGFVPAGFALDPTTVSFAPLDYRRPGALEQKLAADFVTFYFDLVRDSDPASTIKNQFFFDGMDQYKLSEQPFSQEQRVYVIEDKLTVTRLLRDGVEGARVEMVSSINVRKVSSDGRSSSGDYATHRNDPLSGDGLPGPAATFATALTHPDLNDDGLPWTSDYDTDSWEVGLGAMFDIGFPSGTSLLVGGRWDYSRASNTEFAGTLDLSAGTANSPAVFRAADEHASGVATGPSWSISLAQQFGRSIHPYVTFARSSLALDGNNNKYHNDVIERGHIGEGRLQEIGVKASLADQRVMLSAAAYEQRRSDVTDDDSAAVRNAYVSSTRTRGFEAEIKWAYSERLMLSLYALHQETEYVPNAGASIMVDARALGFVDVTDADGNVVYPAEAFLYGGRSYLMLPPDVDEYLRKRGNPDTQFGFLSTFQFRNGFGLTLSGNYFSSANSGRLALVELPPAQVFNAGAFWINGNWQVKCDVFNLTDERYFRARTGDTLGDPLVSVMPGRRWQTTVRVRF